MTSEPMHPHAGATYKLLRAPGRAFAVEVSIPGMNPTLVTGFGAEAEAERWIERHKQAVAAGPPSRRKRPFRERTS
jgi:hypothetical protein